MLPASESAMNPRDIDHPLVEYADSWIVRYWTSKWNVKLERGLWVNILGWMIKHDVFPIDQDLEYKLKAYGSTIDEISLNSIKERELVTRHDVKARIEEFNAVATQWFRAVLPERRKRARLELIHAGMTSADVVDNVSLIKIRQSLLMLQRLGAGEMVTRLLVALPFRGIKGPVGTQQDMIDLLGSKDKADQLDNYLGGHYGFEKILGSVGQVYPRSIDLQVGSTLLGELAALDSNQPWYTILNGYVHMAVAYSGDQWNEGDVSTSVVRRVALPGMFMAASAALRGAKLE